jgi:ubiquinone biosynthesis protein
MAFLQDVGRVSEVARALAKEGFGWLAAEIGLGSKVPLKHKFDFLKGKTYSTGPERLRRICEQLGGAYLKLGQFLSLRSDLIPTEYCDELKNLQDNVKPFSFDTARAIVNRELGKPLEKVFSNFEQQPVGSASIAQAHIAKLKDGARVVVKLQRPDIAKQFKADIEIMNYFAKKMANMERFKGYNPIAIVQEFERYTNNELNFVMEGRNVDRFYAAFKNSKQVKIPKVYWDYSTPKMIVLEHIDGKKLSELKDGKYNKKLIAKALVDAIFTQVFEADIFHGDLHPGNILILPKNKIGLLDFGIVGSLDRELKALSLELYLALLDKDAEKVTKVLLRTGIATRETNVDDFKQDIRKIVNEWYGTTLKEVRFTHMMHQLFDSCISHKIKMPPDLILLAKALLTVEGTAIMLDPDFDFVKETKPYVENILKKEFKGKFSRNNLLRRAKELKDYTTELAEGTAELVNRLKRGTIEIDISDTDIRHLGMDIDKSSNRLSYAIIVAAFAIASSLLINVAPLYKGISVYTMFGFGVALALTMFLFISIFKEGTKSYDWHKN